MKVLLLSVLLSPISSYASTYCYTTTVSKIEVMLNVDNRQGLLLDSYTNYDNYKAEFFNWTYNNSNEKVTLLTSNKEVVVLPFNSFKCFIDGKQLSNKYKPNNN